MRYLGIVMVVCAFLSLGAGNRIESAVYNITPTWGTGVNSVPQMGGTELKLATKLAPGTQVLFEDLMPGANWRHPARYRVVDKNGNVLEEINTDLPPRDLSKATLVKGTLPNWAAVKFEINDFKGAHRVSNPQNHYAILINGHADQRHWNDFSFLYRTLTQIYGFNRENIIVADGVNKEYQGDLDGDGTDDIKYSSTLEGLKAAMADLRDRVTADDEVILAVNDHGSQSGGESTIVLYDTEIKASDFKKLFNEIKAKKVKGSTQPEGDSNLRLSRLVRSRGKN